MHIDRDFLQKLKQSYQDITTISSGATKDKATQSNFIDSRPIRLIPGSRQSIVWGNSDCIDVIDSLENKIITSSQRRIQEEARLCAKFRNIIADEFYITIPSLNSEKFISTTLLSIAIQEGDFKINIHVQDGGSSDGTITLLKEWEHFFQSVPESILPKCKNISFSYSVENDCGMYDAIAKGFLHLDPSENAICTWINSDDFFLPGAFSSVYKTFSKNKNVLWTLNICSNAGENGEEAVYIPVVYPSNFIAEGLCEGQNWRFIQQEGTFWIHGLWKTVGGLNTSLKLCGDWDLWRRFAKIADPVHILWPLARFRRHGNQLSSSMENYYNEMNSIVSEEKRNEAATKLSFSIIDNLRIIQRNPKDDFQYKCSPLTNELFPPLPKGQIRIVNRLLANTAQYKSYKENSALRVLTFCTLATGGAGMGSLRRISALRANNVDARLLSLYSCFSDRHIGRIKPPLDALKISSQIDYWHLVRENACLPIMNDPNFIGQELFSLTFSLIDFEHLKPMFDTSNILHFHWVVGMMDYAKMNRILKDRPVVWTLADMNAFTGGCHYSEGCDGYQRKCKDCPLLKGKSKLPHDTWKIKKNAYSNLDIVFIAPSKYIAGFAKQSSLIGNKRIEVIPNAYPVDKFFPVPKNDARHKLGLPQDKDILLFGTGSLNNLRKGGDILAQAIKLLVQANSRHSFLAVTFGNGSIDIPIPFKGLGSLSEERLHLAYSASDVFISPSREDVGPMTVAESMLCGTPVVGFNVGIIPEIVQHKLTGYIAEPFSSIDLKQGIEWTLEIKNNHNNFSTKIREAALKYCDPNVSAQKHIKLYHSILDESQKNEFLAQKNTYYQDISYSAIPQNEATNESSYNAQLRFLGRKDMNYFTYARWSHWELLKNYAQKLYDKTIDPQTADLKRYQDSFVYAFIKENIPPGARILEVGGGRSRILPALKGRYECWNLDKLEGIGNGPKDLGVVPYKLIRGYIGDFSSELEESYFDFVFSISVLEHVPRDEGVYPRIVEDIDRVLAPGGLSLHLLDFVVEEKDIRMHPLIFHFFQHVETLNTFTDFEKVRHDPDLFMMTETAYKAVWERITRRSYQDFGKPANITVLWQKPERKSNIKPGNYDYNSQKSSIPKFYVLTSCLNNADTIEKTIHSIISQTGTFELHYCVLDRGSTDGTVDLLRMLDSKHKNKKIQAYGNNIHFSWYSVDFSGIYESIRKGFDNMFIASHDFMTWINPGDIFLPDALTILAGMIQEHPDIQWVGSLQQDFEKESIESVPGHHIPTLSKIIRRGSCDENHLSMLQKGRTFFKKALWFKAKHVLYAYREGGDRAFWQEMVKHAEYYEYSRSLMRIAREGNSSQKFIVNPTTNKIECKIQSQL